MDGTSVCSSFALFFPASRKSGKWIQCGGKRYSARHRFLSMSVVAGRRAKAVPRPAHSAVLVTAFQRVRLKITSKPRRGGLTLAQGKRRRSPGSRLQQSRGLKGHLKETTDSGLKRHPMPSSGSHIRICDPLPVALFTRNTLSSHIPVTNRLPRSAR